MAAIIDSGHGSPEESIETPSGGEGDEAERMGVDVLDGHRNEDARSYMRSFAYRQPAAVFHQDRTAGRH